MISIHSESATVKQHIPLRLHTGLLQSGTIMLVEDETFLRDTARDVLRAAGYEVVAARNSVDAMSLFRRHRRQIRMLLTDVVLPGTDGPTLARDLKDLLPTLKVVFISGYTMNVAIKGAACSTDWFYLPKPFSAIDLIEVVERAQEEAL